MVDGETIVKIHKSNSYDMWIDYSRRIPFDNLLTPELEELKSLFERFIKEINDELKKK